ncbi:glycine betaine ABC transporter substrate-binding protein [Eremococcus coleocola]|uniref:ABC transporter, substrate-binding protein, QAT family n=1 Tax=Eremococcus coleocola ACS-139-V-Col8 TaxID=908337 RepID=E4KPS1_9LACT|nr:glycine betaine ABC transporter substrate-binding protein [Eremococcus coleocola]EFR31205.1 ABC transporter, substrate-binding protein, QAT family [Eremococcus coleocola ACS-139-V-Col8]
MKKVLMSILVLVSLLALLPGRALAADKSIRVGSKDFTESLIVGEIYALALEDQGYKVDRVSSIASSVIHTSIVNDEIDLYPEYTGTALLSILKLHLETDPQKVYDMVKAEYEKQFKLTWLDYSPASDSQGLVMRKESADKLGIKTISDLQAKAKDVRFASQGEFDQREDGLLGLAQTYGDFAFKSSTIYDNSLKYQVLASNEADLAPAYTTEGQLVNSDQYVVLEDDKAFWPPYNLAPVIRQDFLKDHQDVADIINKLSAKLDTKTMIELNAKVDVDGQDYEDVAKEFYQSLK